MNKILILLLILAVGAIGFKEIDKRNAEKARVQAYWARAAWLKEAAVAQEDYYEKNKKYADSFSKLGMKSKYSISGCPQGFDCISGETEILAMEKKTKSYRFDLVTEEGSFFLKMLCAEGGLPELRCLVLPDADPEPCLSMGGTLSGAEGLSIMDFPLPTYNIPL